MDQRQAQEDVFTVRNVTERTPPRKRAEDCGRHLFSSAEVPRSLQNQERGDKNTNGERKPDEFTQRGLPGILEASNSSAP